MRVITFAKQYPGYHPRKREPTYFVQKILHSLVTPNYKPVTEIGTPPKFHTIRAGNRWKVGDKFSARYWGDDINEKTGKAGPYQSKQIEFAQLEVKKVWSIKIDGYLIWINKELFSWHSHSHEVEKLAKNDGLTINDFWDWFPKKKGKVFEGQIICWNDSIDYKVIDKPSN